MRSRREKRENEQSLRVQIFVNLADLAREWQFEHSKIVGKKLSAEQRARAYYDAKSIPWSKFPQAIIDQLDEMDYIGEFEKELVSVEVYSASENTNNNNRKEFETWLEEELDPLPGFEVHPFTRKDEQAKKCQHCDEPLQGSELIKGLTTKVACDLLSHAVDDAYDIAVVVMDDPDVVPSVLSVQEIFDKHIVHVGSKGEGEALRSAAWGNFNLETIVAELVPSSVFKERYWNKVKQ